MHTQEVSGRGSEGWREGGRGGESEGERGGEREGGKEGGRTRLCISDDMSLVLVISIRTSISTSVPVLYLTGHACLGLGFDG